MFGRKFSDCQERAQGIAPKLALARLRAELVDSLLIVEGSTGQPVETPLLGAIRNAVALQAKLLGSIAIDASDAARTQAGRALASQRHARG